MGIIGTIFTSLGSFLGGSVFRMLWGEVASFITKRQDHKQEMERMEIQMRQAAASHAQNLETLQLQHDLGVKIIAVQSDADQAKIDAGAFADAVAAVGRPTGIVFVDIWNGIIRPALATTALGILIAEMWNSGGIPTAHVMAVADAILGIYVADRSLGKRGK